MSIIILQHFELLWAPFILKHTLQTAVSLVNIKKLYSSRNNTTWGKFVGPHTIRPGLKVGVLCLTILSGGGGVSGGGSGVSVRARGLCDISRLPIWLGEWTPSNYSCSYCLINLPVSLLHPPFTPHTISFFILFCKRRWGKKKKKITEWQDIRKKRQILKGNGIIQENRSVCVYSNKEKGEGLLNIDSS